MKRAAIAALISAWVIAARKNVLVIIIDDLRPEFGCYNASWMHTPNIDRLAASGTRFNRAYANYAVCNPSRNSFMTGRVPDNTAVWSFHHSFREIMPHQPTIGSYLRDHGYQTTFGGKVFHPGFPPLSDFSRSWSHATGRDPFWWMNRGDCSNSTRDPYCELDCPNSKSLCTLDVGPAPTPVSDDDWTRHGNDNDGWNTLYDERLATWAVDELREFSTNESVPFGMFVGFRRPHNNWRVPETLMQLYQDPPISSNQQYPQNAPPIGFFGGGFDFNNGTASNSFTTPVPEWGQRLARQGYWASVTQTDREVGRVLDALDDYGLANETAVFLFADHGWSLGEANQWHKHSNRVFPARVPLIVRAPWIPTTTQGILVNSTAVELIDLLPTIADVALGSPPPSNQYDGMSMRGVLENPANATGLGRSAAFWQYARCPGNLEKQWQGNGCTPHGRNGIVAMGYTVMTDDWRYTIWLKWDNTTMAPAETEWDTPTFGHELYNHTGDTGLWWDSPQLAEVADVVADPALAPVVAALRSQLKTRFYRSPAETAQRLNAVFQNTVMRQTDPLPWPINQHE